MSDNILSSLLEAPTSRFIYSSLSFYARKRGGELPGTWFVQALTTLGLEETAIRQTLYRMERDGQLKSRKKGRTKLYKATATTRAIIDAGSAKMLESPDAEWDGSWTVVRIRFDRQSRQERDRLRDVLRVEGFALLGPGLYIHSRDRSARLYRATAEMDLSGRMHVFRGRRLQADIDDRRFAGELWDLEGIARRYRRFLARFNRVARRRREWSPELAAALRFAVVFEYLEVAWDDPELPEKLLPRRWPGHRARALVRQLYARLTPRALEFGGVRSSIS